MMKTLFTDKAPAAIGPYSQAKLFNGMLYASGQIPIIPATGNLREGGIQEQTEQVMQNISEVLKAAGAGFEQVVKTTCYLQDMGDFAVFNEVYAKYFTEKPARSCVAVSALPKGALVEVEILAAVE